MTIAKLCLVLPSYDLALVILTPVKGSGLTDIFRFSPFFGFKPKGELSVQKINK